MRLKASNSYRYEGDQGFQELPYSGTVSVLDEKIQSLAGGFSLSLKKRSEKKAKKSRRLLVKEESAKLKFISIQREKSFSEHYQYLKKEQTEKLVNKSMSLKSEEQRYANIKKRNKVPKFIKNTKNQSIFQAKNTIIKQQRQQVGENLEFRPFNSQEVRMLKQQAMIKGQIFFQQQRQCNSHGLFKKYLRNSDPDNFLKSKYNRLLYKKLGESNIHPKQPKRNKQIGQENKKLQFICDYQSANLDFVSQINPFEYDIYLRADTNTLGHQNWFYFKLFNYTSESKSIFLNVCNLKRPFKMAKKGQKIYFREKKLQTQNTLKTSIQSSADLWSQWQPIQDNLQIFLNKDIDISNANKRKKLYKMSFPVRLKADTQYEFSLLPPYTYSNLLKLIQKLEIDCQYLKVQILNYSLLGLAIPILTFTDSSVSDDKKNMTLISARIHPGETCGSFVMEGILKKLSQRNQQISQILKKNVFKIIPMINPDGVVLGNFRTNYLGNDLNRSFDKNSESLFPQIVSLKQIGKQLQKQFGQRFVCFLDLHGHSSQKNIFSYGPNFDNNHKNYIWSRFLPKTLDYISDFFLYEKSTFVLQQSKSNTARGYFLNNLKVMSYTIESSYALYDSKANLDKKNIPLKSQDYLKFGETICNAFGILSDALFQNYSGKSQQNQNKNTVQLPQIKQINIRHEQSSTKERNIMLIGKIRKQLKKDEIMVRRKNKRKSSDASSDQPSDSDGESQSQDLPLKQRKNLQRKTIESHNSFFPRILRPAIVHPEVNPPPPIFSISKISSSSNTKNSTINSSLINAKLKRNKVNNLRGMNANNAYTQYLLKEVKGLDFLRPSVNLMKLQRKGSSIMESLSLSK